LARDDFGEELTMAVITDRYMHKMQAQARTYSLVLMKKAARFPEPDACGIIWEHGRRNHSLRADGVLAIVCPIADDSEWAGIGILDAPLDKASRIMDGDPAILAGVLSYEVHPVRGFPGDTLPPGPLASR
jgi:hypothetical protein